MNIQVVQSKKSDGASEINLQMRHRFKLLLKVVDAKLRPAASSARAAFKRSLFGCRWLLARIDSLERASSNGFCVFVVDIWDHVCTVHCSGEKYYILEPPFSGIFGQREFFRYCEVFRQVASSIFPQRKINILIYQVTILPWNFINGN